MYKIYQEMFFQGKKMMVQVQCINVSPKRLGHKKNIWNKVGDRIYECNECGCKMTIKTDFKEEEVK